METPVLINDGGRGPLTIWKRIKFWFLFDRKQFIPSRAEAYWALANYQGHSSKIREALLHYGRGGTNLPDMYRVTFNSLVWAGCHRARASTGAGRAGEGHLAPGWLGRFVRRVLGHCDCGADE
jgi:hypothetical protein